MSFGVINSYLQHFKTTLELNRTVLGALFGGELGLEATVDFESETCFG